MIQEFFFLLSALISVLVSACIIIYSIKVFHKVKWPFLFFSLSLTAFIIIRELSFSFFSRESAENLVFALLLVISSIFLILSTSGLWRRFLLRWL
jgi:hypothetical protein